VSTAGVGVLLVVVCAIIEGFAQVSLKKSGLHSSRWARWIALAIVCFAVEALVYTKALLILDVSIAYPIGSLSFIAVTVLSWWLLHEKVSGMRWLGVCFILFGAGLIMARA